MKKRTKITIIVTIVALFLGGLGLIGLDNYRASKIKDIQSMNVDLNKSHKSTNENDSYLMNSANNSSDTQEDVNEDDFSDNMDYDNVSIPSIDEVRKANNSKNKDKIKKLVAGQMYIPKLNLTLNIIKGTNKQNMLYGVTTMLLNQKMGEGNYVLAGHNMKQKGVLLSDIIWNDKPRLQKGDTITLFDGQKYYNYEVYQTKTVSKTDTSCLAASEEPILTLFTCTKDDGSGTTNYRFVVQAKLK